MRVMNGMVILMKIRSWILKILRKVGVLQMLYTADFETTTDPQDCRVWAWGVCSIDDPDEFIYGNCMDDFMYYCEKAKNSRFYFHNLKFDGEFIISWLLTNGYQHITDKSQAADKTFTTLISDTGQFYTMTVYFRILRTKKVKVTFYDSLKVLPFSVKNVAKAFGLHIEKLEIDYHQIRAKGHRLSPLEVLYLHNDVKIMALALQQLFKENLTAMTTGSNALRDYKDTLGRFKFDRVFPIPAYDADIRQAYKGGFTWLQPELAGKEIGEGIVLDVNSLYPAVMKKQMPYGEGRYYDGKHPGNRLYNLYVQMLRCQFKLKPRHIPTIQLKSNLSFIPTEYITDSGDLEVTLCLTSIDLELFFAHYDVFNLEYVSGWMFKSTTGLFDEYIDKWVDIKIQAGRDNNKGKRTLAKLMLNSLYGKFALNPNVRSRIPFMEDGIVMYALGEKELRDPIYIPVGAFITAWARWTTITAAQRCYDRFIYADTDSLHLTGTSLPEDLEIHDYKLGAWKHEGVFKQAKYIRAKTYMEYIKEPKDPEDSYQWKITCAGMPDSCHPFVDFDNFKTGSQFPGKLMPLHVPGGIILMETDYTIRK